MIEYCSKLRLAPMLSQEPELLETALAFVARLFWFSLTQLLGYRTGRAAIQTLSLGSLDVSGYGYYNQMPFQMFWRRGKQLVVSFLMATALGQLIWLGAFWGALICLSRS